MPFEFLFEPWDFFAEMQKYVQEASAISGLTQFAADLHENAEISTVSLPNCISYHKRHKFTHNRHHSVIL